MIQDRILNIPKIKVKYFFKKKFTFYFLFFFLKKKKLVREEKVVRAPTRTMSVNLFGLILCVFEHRRTLPRVDKTMCF